MPFGQLVIGPPGSGKTTYCNGMQQFMRAAGRKVEIVNLDPANDGLPYVPAIDLADLVGLEEVMEEFKLGPNGGLIYCMDYLEKNMDWLKEKLAPLEKVNPDLSRAYLVVPYTANTYILFDCPGQVELFTMHGSFQSIIKAITGDWAYRLTAVHLVDAHLCTDPSKFVSGLLLSLSTMLHLELPHVNVLSKIDLVRQYGQLAFNLDYFTEVQDMSHLMATMGDDMFSKRFRKLTRGLCECVEDFGLVSFVPLAIQDKDSVQRLLVLVDKANGHVYAAMAGHSPYPAELLYGSAPLGTDKDMWMTYQERYLEGEVAERVIDEEAVGVCGAVTAGLPVVSLSVPGTDEASWGTSKILPGVTITELDPGQKAEASGTLGEGSAIESAQGSGLSSRATELGKPSEATLPASRAELGGSGGSGDESGGGGSSAGLAQGVTPGTGDSRREAKMASLEQTVLLRKAVDGLVISEHCTIDGAPGVSDHESRRFCPVVAQGSQARI